MSLLRSPSSDDGGELNDSFFDKVTDESFERLEKLCEMLDDENLKNSLPKFKDVDEEVEFILSMEKYTKENIECSTPNRHNKSEFDFSQVLTLGYSNKHVRSSDPSYDTSGLGEVNDTLDEVNLLLEMGNKLNQKPNYQYYTPQRRKMSSPFGKFVRTDRKPLARMANVNFKRGTRHLSPISSDTQNLEVNDLFGGPPLCKSPMIRQYSTSSFHRYRN